MKKIIFISVTFLFISLHGIAQDPNFSIEPGNKFINFKKTIINDDFYNVSQLRIGTYMTLGNYGQSNGSWIGSNAILDYSSYGGRGSLGDKNMFTPAWNQGTALVISPNFVDGNFTGYTHGWNQSSNRVDIKDFITSWNLGPEKSFFMSKVGIGTTNPGEKLHVEGSFLLDAYQAGDQNGLFFREGFSASKKYNLSILTHNDGDNSPDALDINAYDGIYFNTGSNSRNPRMVVKGDGKVGIGIINPGATLHIKDQGNSGVTTLQLNNRIKFRGDGVIDWGSNADYGILSWNTGKAIIGGRTGKDLSLLAGGSEKMIIKSNGNVGIGTSNPDAKLHIKDLNNAPVFNITGKAPNTGNDEPISEIRLSNLYDNLPGHRASIKGISDKSGSHGNVALQFSTSIWNGQHSEINAMRISSNGNIGIGTTDTKGFKLGVKGKIAAEEVKVALYTAWPDYVFENDYNLPTLQEVENHITEKGHLENIPSAATVAENGIQLGEMNAKLLQKIEELTLYMIEQNKKTETLIKEVNALKQKNTELEQKMK